MGLMKVKNTNRIFLVRHGQPVQHGGKIFLGQADIPLSDVGKREAAAAAGRLIRFSARPERIYSSDLLRARETADIIAEKLDVPVVPDKLFREMAMGSWDGELIEDIKNKFPEEYAKRGDDLRNYRVPGGENFYDLRGRVLREFHRIFAEDFPVAQRVGTGEFKNDLIIVAHLGVLTVLAEELLADRPGDSGFRSFATGSVTMLEAPNWLFKQAKEES
jgi:probable phosphoglycerate mutase